VRRILGKFVFETKIAKSHDFSESRVHWMKKKGGV
jgi:hypothetical protein